jgi:transposase InsO family protein
MTRIYLSLHDAAKYEGIDYDSIKKRMYRNPDTYDIKKEPAPNGGKERVMVALTSLSVKAQRAYNADRDSLKVERNVEVSECESLPWYVDGDYASYIENNRSRYDEAIKLRNHILNYLKRVEEAAYSQKKGIACEFATTWNMSVENFYIKVRKYNEALLWAKKREQSDGQSYNYYTVLALCPEPRKKNKFPSLSEQMKAFITSKWFGKPLAQNQATVQMIYDLLQQEAQKQSWIIPSYDTVWRFVNLLMKKYSSEHYLAANGVREWKRNKMFKGRRDTGALLVNEIHVGDAHTFDCWVQVTRSNGRVNAIKPCLVGWLDVRSRALSGWVICDMPDQQIMKESIRRTIYPKTDPDVPFAGVPKYLQIDNGKEYTAESLTGRHRSVRVSFDGDTEGFYRSVGVQDDWRSLPYQPWTKAQIERFFRTVCNSFTRWLTSYVGTLTGSKTTSKIKKDVKKMLQTGNLLTLEDFSTSFEKWLREVYHVRPHGGLKEQGEQWKTPLEVYQNAERYELPAPPIEFFNFSTMKPEIASVATAGISRFNQQYWHPDLSSYVGEKVKILYNPDDIALMHVYDIETNEKICEAECQELLPYGRVNEKTLAKIAKHARIQNGQFRDVREQLADLQELYEEPLNLENEKVIVGPELKDGNPPVVSMPKDEKYRKEKAASRKKQEAAAGDYFRKKGEASLNRVEQEPDSYFQKLGEKWFEEQRNIQ